MSVSLDIRRYDRAPFPVEAVEVTDANMAEVAAWCGGEIMTETRAVPGSSDEVWDVDYIKVAVQRPYNEGQTKAYVGKFITVSETGGYKIYTPTAFASQFVPIIPTATPEFEGVMSMSEMKTSMGLPSPEQPDPETELVVDEVVMPTTPPTVEANHLFPGEPEIVAEEVPAGPNPMNDEPAPAAESSTNAPVADEDYICPQCGADPSGEAAHAVNFHSPTE